MKDCIVVASAEADKEHRLVAYIIPEASKIASATELRLVLSALLPAYMIPATFVTLSSFPLTPSGKIDRKALPAPNLTTLSVIDSPSPRTPTQETVASVWREILKIEKVGIRDNFFNIGGNSLLATRAIGKINETLKVKLRIADIFLMPTVELLAATVEGSSTVTVEGSGTVIVSDTEVIQLQNGNSGFRLYLLGAGSTENTIAKYVGKDRAVFAIDLRMPREWRRAIVTRDRTRLPTLEELGALYGKAIRAHAGSSRCVVAGYSFMGKLAFEAARTYQREGGELAFVALIDALAWSGITRGSARRSWRWIWRRFGAEDTIQESLVYRALELITNFSRLFLWFVAQMPRVVKARLPSSDLSGMADNEGAPVKKSVYEGLARLVGETFTPLPLDSRGILFRADFPGEEFLPGHDIGGGWGKLFSGGLEIVQGTEIM